MKVSKINKFFRRVGEAQIKHRKLCLIILFAVTLVCLSGMRNFRSESSNSDWIVNGSEIKKNSDHFKEVFGNDQYVLVLVQADDVFAPDVLNRLTVWENASNMPPASCRKMTSRFLRQPNCQATLT